MFEEGIAFAEAIDNIVHARKPARIFVIVEKLMRCQIKPNSQAPVGVA
jgi:hypothetical protein